MPEFLSREWQRALEEELAASPDVRALAPLVVEQIVVDVPEADEVRFRIVFDADGVRVGDAVAADADVRITTDYDTAVALTTAGENAQHALARGRLRLGGDLELLAARAGALVALTDAAARLRATTTFPPRS